MNPTWLIQQRVKFEADLQKLVNDGEGEVPVRINQPPNGRYFLIFHLNFLCHLNLQELVDAVEPNTYHFLGLKFRIFFVGRNESHSWIILAQHCQEIIGQLNEQSWFQIDVQKRRGKKNLHQQAMEHQVSKKFWGHQQLFVNQFHQLTRDWGCSRCCWCCCWKVWFDGTAIYPPWRILALFFEIEKD